MKARGHQEEFRTEKVLRYMYTGGEVEMFRAAGTIDEDPVRGAEDMLIVERIKELLLD